MSIFDLKYVLTIKKAEHFSSAFLIFTLQYAEIITQLLSYFHFTPQKTTIKKILAQLLLINNQALQYKSSVKTLIFLQRILK